MTLDRRKFIKKTASGLLVLGAAGLPLELWAKEGYTKLTILHTNDVHSRIEPFPQDGGKYQGMGGIAKRSTLINKIRSEEEHVLLLDSGDILQGTPYFNFYGGELEFQLMDEMGYDASTIGNHDFDGGIDKLSELIGQSKFEMLNCNYDCRDTVLHDKLKDYKIFNFGKLKIGVFGIGIELKGLVPTTLYGATEYNDPLKAANETAAILKREHKCNLVICLSHLGYEYDHTQVSDVVVAENSRNIDLILGGHTHTFMEIPAVHRNLDGEEVLINQVGWAGIRLGRLDYYFLRSKKKVDTQTIKVDN